MQHRDHSDGGHVPGHIISERTRRVLIVDNNIDAGESLCDLLNIFGYETVFFHKPEIALSKLPLVQPDVCIAELLMRDMDGYKFASAIRSLPDFNKIFLIALTVYNWPEHTLASAEAGFDEHLSKDADIGCLMKLIGPAQFFSSTM